MRYLLILILALSVVAATAADAPKSPNADRIAELTKAHAEIMNQIREAEEFIATKRIEAHRIEGAVAELHRQDKATAEKTTKE